jgi:hypothetical protein
VLDAPLLLTVGRRYLKCVFPHLLSTVSEPLISPLDLPSYSCQTALRTPTAQWVDELLHNRKPAADSLTHIPRSNRPSRIPRIVMIDPNTPCPLSISCMPTLETSVGIIDARLSASASCMQPRLLVHQPAAARHQPPATPSGRVSAPDAANQVASVPTPRLARKAVTHHQK